MIFTNAISTQPKDINFNLVNDYVNNQATIVSEHRPFARNSLKGEKKNCQKALVLQKLADACLKARITHADVITLLKQLDYQVMMTDVSTNQTILENMKAPVWVNF